jgi:hypothetical protein
MRNRPHETTTILASKLVTIIQRPARIERK